MDSNCDIDAEKLNKIVQLKFAKVQSSYNKIIKDTRPILMGEAVQFIKLQASNFTRMLTL